MLKTLFPLFVLAGASACTHDWTRVGAPDTGAPTDRGGDAVMADAPSIDAPSGDAVDAAAADSPDVPGSDIIDVPGSDIIDVPGSDIVDVPTSDTADVPGGIGIMGRWRPGPRYQPLA